jgi:hypothetical protein
MCLINQALCHEEILTLALDGGEWLASRPGRFNPGEIASGPNWIGGWVGPELGWSLSREKTYHAGNQT